MKIVIIITGYEKMIICRNLIFKIFWFFFHLFVKFLFDNVEKHMIVIIKRKKNVVSGKIRKINSKVG